MKVMITFLFLLINIKLKHNLVYNQKIEIKHEVVKQPQFNIPKEHKKRYNAAYPYLKDIAEKTNLPIEIPIIFWIEETGYGTSELFVNNNNWGGIKSKSLTSYRNYNSLEEGANDWIKVLSQKRYTKYFPDNKFNIIAYIQAYNKGGYWEGIEQFTHNRINIYKRIKTN